jgi:UDP-N-acetylmuramoyl-tripeptide--D-alanyl-D-alanine ligase
MELTPTLVAEALGCDRQDVRAPAKGTPARFSGISTDSRTAGAGVLFFAIRGNKFDGHDFLAEVARVGAGGVVVARGTKLPPEAESLLVYFVDDTLDAIRRLAAYRRARFSGPVVAVAGSVGKTTTKELLAAALRGRYRRVLKTEDSQNGFLGIALTLLRLDETDEAAVIEVGIDTPGAMAKHLEIVRPTAAVVTAIAEEHLETMISLEVIAREEALPLQWVARHGGLAAVNADDPWLAPLCTHGDFAKATRYALVQETPPRREGLLWAKVDRKSRTLHVHDFQGKTAFFPIPLPGDHNARNLLAAVAVAHAMGLSETQIRNGLATFEPPKGRSELRSLSNGAQIVCDYYNASPASMRSGIEMLSQLGKSRAGSTWACLADMLELGSDEERLHRELAEPLLKSTAGHILLTGPRMKALHDELVRRKAPGEVAWFETPEQLGTALARGLRGTDTVLIKGSRGMRMERVLEALERALSA